MSLHLAMIALEGLFGRAAVRLDARYRLDEPGRAIVVDGATAVGDALVRVFATLLIREFGDDSFAVGRVTAAGEAPAAAPARPAIKPWRDDDRAARPGDAAAAEREVLP